MIHDLAKGPLPQAAIEPLVVVGSGAAGIAIGLTLADRGRSVLMVESGPDVIDRDGLSGDDPLIEGDVAGQRYDGLVLGRARVLGGATQLWHGQCMRLNEIDLRRREWVADSGWPIDLGTLGSYYDAAERWFGLSGRGYGAGRWAEYPWVKPVPWSPNLLQHDFTEYTARPFLGSEYRARIADHPNLHLVLNATVSRVVVDGGRACGVEVADPSGGRHLVPAGSVALCAGGLENARLLQLSDPEGVGLGAGRQHTGRYLQDHPIIRTAQVHPHDHRVLRDRYISLRRGRDHLFPKVRLSPAVQEDQHLLDATAVFVHDYDDPGMAAARRLLLAARAKRIPPGALRDAVRASGVPLPLMRSAYRRLRFGLPADAVPSAVWLQIWLEQAPDPDRRIVLSARRNPLGLPRPEIRWNCTDEEIRTSRVFTRLIADELSRLHLATVSELEPMRDDEAWRSAVTDAFHPAGTTRMSKDPQNGVVDTDLQVHGVQHLFAVGSSVFPTSGYANPTLTIVAIALRAADYIESTVAARPSSLRRAG